MTTSRTVYRQINSKLITPEMYDNDAISESTVSVGSWHNSILSALSDLGVSMSPHNPSDVDSFLSSSDVVRDIVNVFPVNTFGYGYQGSPKQPADINTFAGEYNSATKFYFYHFSVGGHEYSVQLSVHTNGTVRLAVLVAGNDAILDFTISSAGSHNSSKLAGLLLQAVVSAVSSGKVADLEGIAKNHKQTLGFIDAYQQSQKGSSKKKVKSSLRPSSSQLTQHDIETLLSRSNPSHVFWSPLLNKAAIKDSRGWYVASFCYLNSSWTLDWFTLSASLVKSNGCRYIRYSGSKLFPID